MQMHAAGSSFPSTRQQLGVENSDLPPGSLYILLSVVVGPCGPCQVLSPTGVDDNEGPRHEALRSYARLHLLRSKLLCG
jgi:hypothetical protein